MVIISINWKKKSLQKLPEHITDLNLSILHERVAKAVTAGNVFMHRLGTQLPITQQQINYGRERLFLLTIYQ